MVGCVGLLPRPYAVDALKKLHAAGGAMRCEEFHWEPDWDAGNDVDDGSDTNSRCPAVHRAWSAFSI